MGLGQAAGFAVYHRVLSHGHWCSRAARASAPAAAGRRLRAGRPGGGRSRRHHRAALGRADRGARDLPRPGPLQPRPLRQGQRPALALRHAAGAGALGRLRLGPALPDRAGALRALRRRAGQAAQEADRLGPAGAAAGRPLAAGPARRRGGRQQLLGHRPAARPRAAPDRSHPSAPRCLPVQPTPGAPATARGRPPVRGARLPSLAERLRNRRTPWRRVAIDGWYGRTHPPARHRHRHRALAPPRQCGWRSAGCWCATRAARRSRRPSFAPTSTAEPADILRWFVRRWRTETTFEEARRHLGMETQRQWSDLAILRTTPALLGLFSLVTLWASRLAAERGPLVECVRWYPKPLPTFSDALALVRRELWTAQLFATLPAAETATECPGRSDRPPPARRLPAAMTHHCHARASRHVQSQAESPAMNPLGGLMRFGRGSVLTDDVSWSGDDGACVRSRSDTRWPISRVMEWAGCALRMAGQAVSRRPVQIILCASACQSPTALAFSRPRTRKRSRPRLRHWALTHSAVAARSL